MKKLLCAFMLLPVGLVAQDCGLKKSVDPFTHVNKLSTGFKKFDNSGLTVLVTADATPTDIDFFFWIKDGEKCFDSESTAVLVYDGERSRANFRNSGSMNCEGAFHFIFKNTTSTNGTLNRLTQKKVATIKLSGTNKTEVLLTLTEEQKTLLQQMATCIAVGAKTLLKQ